MSVLFCWEKHNSHAELYPNSKQWDKEFIKRDKTEVKWILMRYATVGLLKHTYTYRRGRKWPKHSGKHHPHWKSRLPEHLSNEWVDNLCIHSTCRCVVFCLCREMKYVVFYFACASFTWRMGFNEQGWFCWMWCSISAQSIFTIMFTFLFFLYMLLCRVSYKTPRL